MVPAYRSIIGWLAVMLSTLATCFWAFWGIIETFHEGWWHSTIWMNLGSMLVFYLLLMWVFWGAGILAIRWPRVGGGFHLAAALIAGWFFRGASLSLLIPFIVGPLALMGIAYWVGRPQPRRLAMAVLCGLPLLTLLVFGVEPACRVSQRLDDGNRGARRLSGNGVDLIWAPQGPGWPPDGVSWNEAMRRCRYLTEDGLSLAEEPQNVWRLPEIHEAVASMQRRGRNSGGRWDTARRKAVYEITPDKESPLWDVHSQIIYWWTATELSDDQALIIVYDGKAWPRRKHFRPGYLGFRAVKDSGEGTASRPGEREDEHRRMAGDILSRVHPSLSVEPDEIAGGNDP